jgi:hypothetical protein
MKIKLFNISEIKPYKNNPRINDASVKGVAESIKQFGFKQPIVIDADNIIIAGHTRLKAAKELGLKKVPCVIASDLSPEQIKAYRILDNKLAEKSEWDIELLNLELKELADFDFTEFDIDFNDSLENDTESKYTNAINIPPYEKSETKPNLEELYDIEYVKKLIEDINKTNLSEPEKEFLICAAYRHARFNFKKIADYFAHSDVETQKLIEDSALVIVDIKKAIEKGWVDLTKEFGEIFLTEKEAE